MLFLNTSFRYVIINELNIKKLRIIDTIISEDYNSLRLYLV